MAVSEKILYFRLAVFSIELPPLRERDGDVVLLATHFLKKHAPESGKRPKGFNPSASKAMGKHAWPGNVRELENRIKRAIIMADGAKITPSDLDLDSQLDEFFGMGLKEAREAAEKKSRAEVPCEA